MQKRRNGLHGKISHAISSHSAFLCIFRSDRVDHSSEIRTGCSSLPSGKRMGNTWSGSDTRCICWTHLRRYFVEALPKDIDWPDATLPAIAIKYINQLFDIEKKLEILSPKGRQEQRLVQEGPVLEAFWSWVEETAPKALPNSKLGKAFTYAKNQKLGLMNYLLDGNCSISNNLAENSIRPFTIGRKNWLFSGSPKGAEASAGIYTLIETAKANGLNPMKYIQFILSDIPGTAFLEFPEYLEEYMPWDPLIQKICR